MKTTLEPDGTVVIPLELLEQAGIEVGDWVDCKAQDGVVVLSKKRVQSDRPDEPNNIGPEESA